MYVYADVDLEQLATDLRRHEALSLMVAIDLAQADAVFTTEIIERLVVSLCGDMDRNEMDILLGNIISKVIETPCFGETK